MGDSKTARNEWPPVIAATEPTVTVKNLGVGGTTVASTASTIATILAAGPPASDDLGYVLVNLGINDVYLVTGHEAEWKADWTTILDAIHTRWPSYIVYLAKPWGSWSGAGTNTVGAELDTMAGWIDDVVAGCAYCAAGIDERGAGGIQGADNGVTYTTDGVHYNPAGAARVAALWKTVLGL